MMVEFNHPEEPQENRIYRDVALRIVDDLREKFADFGLTIQDLRERQVISPDEEMVDFVYRMLEFDFSILAQAIQNVKERIPESTKKIPANLTDLNLSSAEEMTIRLESLGENTRMYSLGEFIGQSAGFRKISGRMVEAARNQQVSEWNGGEFSDLKSTNLTETLKFLEGELKLVTIGQIRQWALAITEGQPNSPDKTKRYWVVTDPQINSELSDIFLQDASLMRQFTIQAIKRIQKVLLHSLEEGLKVFAQVKKDQLFNEADELNDRVRTIFFDKLFAQAQTQDLELLVILRDEFDAENFASGPPQNANLDLTSRGSLRFKISKFNQTELKITLIEDDRITSQPDQPKAKLAEELENQTQSLFVRKNPLNASDLEFAVSKLFVLNKHWLSLHRLNQNLQLDQLQQVFRDLQLTNFKIQRQADPVEAAEINRKLKVLAKTQTASEFANLLKTLGIGDYPYRELIVMPAESKIKLLVTEAFMPRGIQAQNN